MTIAKEDREFLELFRQATPEGKRLMVIELIALNRLVGQAGREIPKCSRAEYKRHIKALRQVQHTSNIPLIKQTATKSIDLIREVCPIK